MKKLSEAVLEATMDKLYIPVLGSYRISQTFAEHVQRRINNGWPPGSYNGGIDYACATGTTIIAAADGVVASTQQQTTGYGWHIRINHGNGFLSIYGHLSRIDVAAGQTVKAGDQIGLSGNTGNSTGPHLHFEVRKDNVEWNPEAVMVAWQAVPSVPRPETPELPRVHVLPDVSLRIRRSPGVASNNVVGHVTEQDGSLSVMQIIENGSDVWLKIGHNQYIADTYQGTVYVAWE